MAEALDAVVREAGVRVRAALAARFRDLDIAEEAFADACVKAAELWPRSQRPADPAAWIYRTAERRAIDMIRKRRVRERLAPEPNEAAPTAEELLMDDASLIPDERLKLIFVCCHPAVAPESRAALTLRLVCGLSTVEIARAFLVPEPTLAQRLVRAKRKIAEAGVPFEIPAPQLWADRLEAVLTTLEIAYSKAHEDAAAKGPYSEYASEMLSLTRLLADLVPDEAEALALAATVRFAEARRPARMDAQGVMVPLSDQDPALWNRELINEAGFYLQKAQALQPFASRVLKAAIHAAWCSRSISFDPPPWRNVLRLYDLLLSHEENPVLRLNRAVALAEVEGPASALVSIAELDQTKLSDFLPFHVVRADLFRKLGRWEEAKIAYRHALSLTPGSAETAWLERQLQS